MKKILISLLFVFCMPIVNAANCQDYQCLTCSYNLKNETISYLVQASSTAGKGKVEFSVGDGSKKSNYNANNTLSYNLFYNNNKLLCPRNLYGKEKSGKIVLSFVKENGYNKEYKFLSGNINDNPVSHQETDWGPIENTNIETICSKPELRKPLKFIGTLITVLKIVIPILIVVFGIIDLFKAIPSSKDDRVMVAVKSILIRMVAGIFIFFIPGIIQVILDWVNEWSNYQNTWCCCTQCILDSGKCDVNSCSSDSCHIGGMN